MNTANVVRDPATACTFFVELIKPSHYDDDGYVIQWWRGFVPSNSLSTLNGLAQSSRARHILGSNVEIEVEAYDETTTAIPVFFTRLMGESRKLKTRWRSELNSNSR